MGYVSMITTRKFRNCRNSSRQLVSASVGYFTTDWVAVVHGSPMNSLTQSRRPAADKPHADDAVHSTF